MSNIIMDLWNWRRRVEDFLLSYSVLSFGSSDVQRYDMSIKVRCEGKEVEVLRFEQ